MASLEISIRLLLSYFKE